MDPVSDLVTHLSNRELAQSPAQFPVDRPSVLQAGMYSWWADEDGQRELGRSLGVLLPPLIYVGQAGATKWPSGTLSRATLLSRIGRQHIRGNPRSSTFRLTISALLLDSLGLVALGGRALDDASNRRVSNWIASHLEVVVAPVADRDQLAAIESAVVRDLDPPLNLGHCLPTSARQQLTALRRALG